MAMIKMFKSNKTTKSINLNQDVWVVNDYANHLDIRYKFRGKGRYVNAIIDKWNHKGTSYNQIIGENGLKEIEVDEEFYLRLSLIS